MQTLEQYLNNRELSLDPIAIEKDTDTVLVEDGLLEEVSELWTAHEGAIKAVLQQRINAIGKHLLNKAIPQETVVLRQALVEIGAIVTDFDKYKAEQGRRKAKAEDNTDDNTPDKPEGDEPPAPPPVEEGKEGSL